jgi:glucose-1-phosphatase
MKNRIDAIIFDMGGVFLKTIDPRPREAMALRFGTTRKDLESIIFSSSTSLLSETGEISDQEHWQTVLQLFNQPIDNYLKIYDEYFSGDVIDEDLLDYAVSLKTNFCVGLLSNAWMNARTLLEERFHFIDKFNESLFSYEVGLRKPDPNIYLKMVEMMGVKPENALFIDDLVENVNGAISAGLQSIQYIDTQSLIKAVRKITAG